MNGLTLALATLLGSGGIGGVVAFLRLRTDKGATVVDTVAKGVLVQDRIIQRLEGDLISEHRARIAAETERDELRRLLTEYGPLPDDRKA